VTEKIEFKGYWFLPQDPDNKIAGLLTFTPYDSIILELFGKFKNIPILQMVNSIWGVTNNNKKVTLLNCTFISCTINTNGAFPISKYDIQICLDGIQLNNSDQKEFNRSVISFRELTPWCPPIIAEMENDDISSDQNHISSVTINYNTTINLKYSRVPSHNFDFNFKSITVISTILEIKKSEESSINDFLKDSYLFQSFLSLASLSTVSILEFNLFSKTEIKHIANGNTIFTPIKLYYILDNEDITEKKRYDFLFEYKDIKELFPIILPKWYDERNNIAPIREHLILSVQKKRYFRSADFLIVIQAIEGFWWRFRDENYKKGKCISKRQRTPLTTIINELINEFNSIKKIDDLNFIIETIVDSRNYYSHFVNESSKPDMVDGIDLIILTKKLRILLQYFGKYLITN